MRKLNIGSGGDYRTGFVNLERFKESDHHQGKTESPDIYADAHDLPFQSESFDRVLIRHVLEHLTHPYEALIEAKRVLKPGGLCYIELPNATEVDVERRDHLYSWTPWTLHNLVLEIGFSIEGYQQSGINHGITVSR